MWHMAPRVCTLVLVQCVEQGIYGDLHVCLFGITNGHITYHSVGHLLASSNNFFQTKHEI